MNLFNAIGKPINAKISAKEAIEEAKLNFTVEKVKAQITTLEGFQVDIPNSYATYRTDNNHVFNHDGRLFTKRYEVVQNQEAFAIIDNLIKEEDLKIETAGSLNEGGTVFISIRCLNDIRLGNSNDIIQDYIVITTSHDGSGQITILLTPVRVICENTLHLAMRTAKFKIMFKHTTKVADKLKNATQVLGLHKVYIEEMTRGLIGLSKITVGEKDIKDVLNKLFLDPNQIKLVEAKAGKIWHVDEISKPVKQTYQGILEYTEVGLGQDMYRGTGLWLYNGINGYYHNRKEYDSPDEKFMEIMDGDSLAVMNKSLPLIQALNFN